MGIIHLETRTQWLSAIGSMALLVVVLVVVFVFTVRQGFIDSIANQKGDTMQARLVTPTLIGEMARDRKEHADRATRKTCKTCGAIEVMD